MYTIFSGDEKKSIPTNRIYDYGDRVYVPNLDGPYFDGPHLDGPYLDGPYLDGFFRERT